VIMMDELLDIVDANDKVIGQDTKANKFEKELISRNVAIFLRDSAGNFIIVQRAANKRSFPNRLDVAACGNVSAGESYEQAAKREMQEEIGITCEIRMLKKIYHEFEEKGKMLRYFTGIFIGTWDRSIQPNEEIAGVMKMTTQQIKSAIERKPDLFTPGFVSDFHLIEACI
jgi:isopentenyldiphosphate isomerase